MTFTSQELHLIRLLSERFDVHELYRTLVGLSDEAPLKARLMEPTSTTPLAFATHAVFVLRAAGLIEHALFAALVTERASLAGEIWGVAALFGVSHPDAAPVEPLPEHFAALAEAHAALRTFVGRAEQLALLRAVLLPGPARPASVCSLQGMAGVGKSFLVERFYAEHRASFPGGHLKITLGYDAVPTAEGLLSDLAERLGVLQGPGRVEERVRGAVMATRALVHLDNLDSEEQAQAAVVGGPPAGRADCAERALPVWPCHAGLAAGTRRAVLCVVCAGPAQGLRPWPRSPAGG
ncbi:MAG: ATP-binding protein [Deltaproteobacteria bacterium]|nr:ATP-binding protein [Deltaproteobacteria bacterium]